MGVPSVPKDPSRLLQIIGAGYSRTGALSMPQTLETLLDGPVMQGGSQLLSREDGMTDHESSRREFLVMPQLRI
jgi:hypothetical protein